MVMGVPTVDGGGAIGGAAVPMFCSAGRVSRVAVGSI
jgi:hypothetical protein